MGIRNNEQYQSAYWRRISGDLPLCPPDIAAWLECALARRNIFAPSIAHRRALLVASAYLDRYDEVSYALDAALLEAAGEVRLVRGRGFLTFVKILPARVLDGRGASSF